MEFRNCIDGKWSSGTGKKIKSIDPSEDKSLGHFYCAENEIIDAAIQSSQKAFIDWSDKHLEERLEYLSRFKELLTKNKDSLARAISIDSGKVFWDAQTEVNAMIGKLDHSLKAFNERIKNHSIIVNNIINYQGFRPIGVMAIFGPFNFPGHLPNGHIMPALLSGNTVILKPSEKVPYVSEKIMELWLKTEIPPGVINMVQGDGETGVILTEHKGINGVLFTGSLETGIKINKQLAEEPYKILALEMGGNNPIIIDEVQNINAAVHLAILSSYISSGQRCTCGRRLIIVENDRSDKFISELILAVQSFRYDKALSEPQPFIGPLIDIQSADKMLHHQEIMRIGGADILIPMKKQECKALLSPGLIDVTDIEIEDKENFGPLLHIIRVNDFKSAIREANKSQYGLSAALFSDNKNHFEEFYKRINAGVINWNRQTTGASSAMSFGGIGMSGNYRPSGYFASDYCSHPVSSLQTDLLKELDSLPPGLY